MRKTLKNGSYPYGHPLQASGGTGPVGNNALRKPDGDDGRMKYMLHALATWSNLTVGILLVAIGLFTLARRQAVFRWQQRRFRWKPYAWSWVCLGSMFLLGNLEGPASDFSAVLGLAVFIGVGATGAAGLLLLTRAQRPLVTPGN